ncbi:MAG: hypothetical protein H6736_06160 [Alphaproteobacteria bacterium]|nr:hypothetical protein [Alphaproteobacteria bacterium]MCB9691384.1 hypothetical protein [Alphaproteobacteria bacterium]
MLRTLSLLVSGTVLVGCQCRPDPSVPTPPEPTETPPEPTGDTAPPPPCDVPESEPNNALDDADALPLEADACGEFQVANDGDRWWFELARDEWVSVRLDARENGSLANPMLVLAGPGVVAQRVDGDETADAELHVPLTPGVYDLQVRDQDGSGDGDGRWFYDLQASVQKAPTDWDALEVEPNGSVATASPLPLGTSAFGLLDTPGDADVFAVPVPTGRHTVALWVEAFALGSPADTVLHLLDADGASPGCGADNPDCAYPRGEIGFESDPWLLRTSEGDETLWVRVRNEAPTQGSPAHWYVVRAEAR